MSLAYLKLPLLFRYYHVLPKCRHHSTLVLFCISAFDRNIPFSLFFDIKFPSIFLVFYQFFSQMDTDPDVRKWMRIRIHSLDLFLRSDLHFSLFILQFKNYSFQERQWSCRTCTCAGQRWSRVCGAAPTTGPAWRMSSPPPSSWPTFWPASATAQSH